MNLVPAVNLKGLYKNMCVELLSISNLSPQDYLQRVRLLGLRENAPGLPGSIRHWVAYDDSDNSMKVAIVFISQSMLYASSRSVSLAFALGKSAIDMKLFEVGAAFSLQPQPDIAALIKASSVFLHYSVWQGAKVWQAYDDALFALQNMLPESIVFYAPLFYNAPFQGRKMDEAHILALSIDPTEFDSWQQQYILPVLNSNGVSCLSTQVLACIYSYKANIGGSGHN